MKNTMSFVARAGQLLSKHPTMRVNSSASVNYVNQQSFYTHDSHNYNLCLTDKHFKKDEQPLSESTPSLRIEELKKNSDAFDELTKKYRTSLFADKLRSKDAKDLSNLFHSYVREEERKEAEKNGSGCSR